MDKCTYKLNFYKPSKARLQGIIEDLNNPESNPEFLLVVGGPVL